MKKEWGKSPPSLTCQMVIWCCFSQCATHCLIAPTNIVNWRDTHNTHLPIAMLEYFNKPANMKISLFVYFIRMNYIKKTVCARCCTQMYNVHSKCLCKRNNGCEARRCAKYNWLYACKCIWKCTHLTIFCVWFGRKLEARPTQFFFRFVLFGALSLLLSYEFKQNYTCDQWTTIVRTFSFSV